MENLSATHARSRSRNMGVVQAGEWTTAVESLRARIKSLVEDLGEIYVEHIRSEFSALSDEEKVTLFMFLLAAFRKVSTDVKVAALIGTSQPAGVVTN